MFREHQATAPQLRLNSSPQASSAMGNRSAQPSCLEVECVPLATALPGASHEGKARPSVSFHPGGLKCRSCPTQTLSSSRCTPELAQNVTGGDKKRKNLHSHMQMSCCTVHTVFREEVALAKLDLQPTRARALTAGRPSCHWPPAALPPHYFSLVGCVLAQRAQSCAGTSTRHAFSPRERAPGPELPLERAGGQARPQQAGVTLPQPAWLSSRPQHPTWERLLASAPKPWR